LEPREKGKKKERKDANPAGRVGGVAICPELASNDVLVGGELRTEETKTCSRGLGAQWGRTRKKSLTFHKRVKKKAKEKNKVVLERKDSVL